MKRLLTTSSPAHPNSVRVAFVLLLASCGLLLGACSGEGGAVGSPCEFAEECDSGLICDMHGGAGTCQKPHEH